MSERIFAARGMADLGSQIRDELDKRRATKWPAKHPFNGDITRRGLATKPPESSGTIQNIPTGAGGMVDTGLTAHQIASRWANRHRHQPQNRIK